MTWTAQVRALPKNVGGICGYGDMSQQLTPTEPWLISRP